MREKRRTGSKRPKISFLYVYVSIYASCARARVSVCYLLLDISSNDSWPTFRRTIFFSYQTVPVHIQSAGQRSHYVLPHSCAGFRDAGSLMYERPTDQLSDQSYRRAARRYFCVQISIIL